MGNNKIITEKIQEIEKISEYCKKYNGSFMAHDVINNKDELIKFCDYFKCYIEKNINSNNEVYFILNIKGGISGTTIFTRKIDGVPESYFIKK